MSEQPSLSLDIGTRKVVGLLTRRSAKGLQIVAAEKREHLTRAMFDGQIHDVEAVAEVVSQIVTRLSAKAGGPLCEAAVAAAGRALRTVRGTASRELSGLTELSRDEVFTLEMEAVQAAQGALAAMLQEGEGPQAYNYVGHSVAASRLDGLAIANLVGQRGRLAEVEVIATFLPRGVVDSLLGVLHRTGLEMTGLTLEPIAALNVIVPSTMRHLNLALVDIGAGTSDIAVTAKGSVTAYDMVSMAGDEITEALSEAFLLDFAVGEAVKRKMSAREPITFEDILGGHHTASTAELTEVIRPAAERLADQIGQRILKLNGGPPQAVLLVGGGSLTAGLPALLAQALGLPEARVAVRGRDAIAGVEGAKSLLKGPDAVTPIGIAVAARDRSTLGFDYLHVNGVAVRLFHPARLTVADALLAAGVAIRNLQGPIGKGLTVTVNGHLRIVRGTFGTPPRILVGGEPATLDSPVVHRDEITVEPGLPGEPGQATVADLAPKAGDRLEVTVNGTRHELRPLVTVNGQVAEPDQLLSDNDQVVVRPLGTVADVMAHLGYEEPGASRPLRFSLDGVTQVVRRAAHILRLNGALAGPETPVQTGDQLAITPVEPLTVGEAAAGRLHEAKRVRVMVNGQPYVVANGTAQVTRNGRPASPGDLVAENDAIAVLPDTAAPIFADLFPLIGISAAPPSPQAALVMRLNGEAAEFITPLRDGDQAEVRWA